MIYIAICDDEKKSLSMLEKRIRLLTEKKQYYCKDFDVF